MEEKEPTKKVKASQHESYWTFTLIAIVVPIVGIILGIVYLTKSKPVERKLGEHLLALGILMMFVFWIIFSIGGAFTTARNAMG